MSIVTNTNKNQPKEVELYWDILNTVEIKVFGESRHETAIRYIKEAENNINEQLSRLEN